ncbi:hypothetical protein GCM10017044_15280 [Kordiimonas sediminis]|uniref:Uncharacterized protein n=1 Tax=Kordiimonas sediminis TaxID=1735581 RepID=A0A919ARR9_9PROT|nr:hypothetical protein [Kordiimonas sediminis]GHF22117.1 hypothetical protein GCM10017044_15280 [Kordiimonas sediminis]
MVGNDAETAATATRGKALDNLVSVSLKAAEKLPKVEETSEIKEKED